MQHELTGRRMSEADDLILRLKKELLRQWVYNYFEHVSWLDQNWETEIFENKIWPMPEIILEISTKDEVRRLISEFVAK